MTQPWDAFDGKKSGFATIVKATVAICRVYNLFSDTLVALLNTIPSDVLSTEDKNTVIQYVEYADAACRILRRVDKFIKTT